MARYRKIDPKIWNDRKFMEMSDNGKLAFLFGLTHPFMTSLGAMRASLPGLASELGWQEEDFRLAFAEAKVRGMVRHDEEGSMIWYPKFLHYNRPESINSVKGWANALEMLPECDLKAELIQQVKEFSLGLPEAFRQALPLVIAKARPFLGARNKEQEQEQEKECVPSSPSSAVSKPAKKPKKPKSSKPAKPPPGKKPSGSDPNLPRGQPTSEHHGVIDHFCRLHREKFGIDYDFKGGKDGNLVKRMLRTYGLDRLTAMIELFFECGDGWPKKAGYTIGTLSQMSNSLAQKLEGEDHGSREVSKFTQTSGPVKL